MKLIAVSVTACPATSPAAAETAKTRLSAAANQAGRIAANGPLLIGF
jgi:hypothetical protein